MKRSTPPPPCSRTGRGTRRPRPAVHAHGARGRLHHAGLRPHRRGAFGGVRRLRLGQPGAAHRRCRAQGDRVHRRRFARGQVVPYKPLLDRALGLCKTRRPPWWCSTEGWRPSSRWRGETWTTPRCAPGIRARGCRWPGWSRPNQLYPVHVRHDRQAQGVQRDTGGCRGAGFFHGVPVQRQAGRHVLLHQRHRLGGGALVHHLWPADRRPGHHPVRRHAGAAGRRHPVEAGGKVPGQHAVLGADRGARAQAPGSGPAEKHDLSSLRAVYLAGEPLDEPTAQWISQGLGKPIIDNYWQTESGWPILSAQPGVESVPTRFGSPSFPVYGFDARIVSETTGEDLGPDQKGVVAIMPPLPPGAMSTIWGDDERFVQTYFTSIPGRQAYSTFDWGWWTRTATGSSWAAPTTSSTWPAIAWARARSRNLSTATRPSPSAPWSAWPTRSRAGGHGLRRAEESRRRRDAGGRAATGRRYHAAGGRSAGSRGAAGQDPVRGALPKTRSGKVLRRAIVAVCEDAIPET